MSQTDCKQIQHATLGAHLIVGLFFFFFLKRRGEGGSKLEVFSGEVGLTA